MNKEQGKMSSVYKFNDRSYAKMMFHAAKYPHFAVNGIILSSVHNTCEIVDVVPLFHQCLYVSPMAEIALRQVIVSNIGLIQKYILMAYSAKSNHIHKPHWLYCWLSRLPLIFWYTLMISITIDVIVLSFCSDHYVATHLAMITRIVYKYI